MKRWTRGEKWLWATPISFGIVAVAAKFGPDAARRALGRPQQLVNTSTTHIRSMALSGNGKLLANGIMISSRSGWARGSGKIELWNARTLTPIAAFPPVYTRDKTGFTNGFDIYAIAISPDAKNIGFSRATEKWQLCDVKTQATLWRFSCFIQDAQFSRDGRWIALSSDKNITVVNAGNGRVRSQWARSGTPNSSDLSLSPDGNLVASIGPYNSNDPIELHRATDGKLVRRIANKLTNSVAFSPDGKRLLVASSVLSYSSTDNFNSFAPVRCYDTNKGNLLWQVKSTTLGGADGRHSAICDAIYPPDGRSVAAYQNRFGQIFILDATTGAIQNKLNFGSASPTGIFVPPALAFSPDSKRLFARGKSAVLVWDLPYQKSVESFDSTLFFILIRHLQNRQKRFLRNLHVADLLHALFAFARSESISARISGRISGFAIFFFLSTVIEATVNTSPPNFFLNRRADFSRIARHFA